MKRDEMKHDEMERDEMKHDEMERDEMKHDEMERDTAVPGRKGIVFTLDAVYALYIFLIMATTFVMLQQAPVQGDDVLFLSRLARDAYEVKWFYTAAPSFPQYLFDAACANAAFVGSEAAVEYAGAGALRLNITKVCANG